MKILFLCTAHNSLSQRLYLALSTSHDVTIEYALSDELMISAVVLSRPDLVICPFLTTFVPKEIYDHVLTLIIHPGPPGDAGPSALDWLLMGDDGSIDDETQLLQQLSTDGALAGRSHWGVTALRATQQLDAGPVWAFDHFSINIDQPGMTKSEVYRGPVTVAAIAVTLSAIVRIQDAVIDNHRVAEASKAGAKANRARTHVACSPFLTPQPGYAGFAVSDGLPFQGGKLRHRPLLKATDRDFDPCRHTAQQISRRIRCGDSQPGVMTQVFGRYLYVYGGIIDDGVGELQYAGAVTIAGTKVLATRNEAICIATSDGKGIWITNTRRPKMRRDTALWPKVPATFGLVELGILTADQVQQLHWALPADWSLSSHRTFQEVWVDFNIDDNRNRTAYLHFEFYNGAMSTRRCLHLIDAMDYILSRSTVDHPIRAIVLMGGSYFSNGIALNVIEAAADPSTESFHNICAIDDVVHHLLHVFPSHGIATVAAIRGNAAAGGVALATACDVVIAGSEVVLNPAYRCVGLHGSEYHTLSYSGRCGEKESKAVLRAMTPMSPLQAQAIGLVDYVFPGSGKDLEDRIRYHVAMLLRPGISIRGYWKANVDLLPSALARARTMELCEMSKDFWSARSIRYHTRRYDFVRKVKSSQTPFRFATHRRQADSKVFDEEELDSFDDINYYKQSAQQQNEAALHDQVGVELNSLIDKWSEHETMSRSHRLGSVTLHTDKEMAHVAMPGTERKTETVFSCYYKPVDAPPTPPVSPHTEPEELTPEISL
ncbi:hypothetical protein LTR36_007514 [Oleoguttula mirabilis]|uniref:Formyl transferase C-terminal domain-containing protein n=1 Tax=Oleoguttula mirabilis TaxID=1507867 RepID=A0AAV9JTM5_9PEZI|nr:hypothetical protein LTR36_007514 [Oleoguttula mirabilis]